MALINAATKPDDFVVSDQQMQAFRTGRLVPPDLCDTSIVRIKSGYLTTEQAIKAASNAKMIIFWTGRLEMLPGFQEWVRNHYRLAVQIDGRLVYV